MKLPALDRLEFPVFMSDPGGELTFVNEPWREQLGVEVGSPWRDAFPQLDAAGLQDSWRACHQNLQPFVFQAHAKGTEYRIICQPAETDDGSAIHVLGALTDVTAQSIVQAEAEAILDTAVDAIIIIDEQGTIENLNQAATELFGYQRDEIIGKSVNTLMPEPHRSKHDEYIRNYLGGAPARIIGIGQ
jgi:PAS domain-containing protein